MKKFLAMALVAVFLVSGLVSLLPEGTGEVTNSLYDDGGVQLDGGEIRIPTNGGVDTSYYLKVNRDVPISDATVDISTYGSAEGNALLDPYLDVGLDGNAEWEYTGTGYGKFGEQTYLSTGKDKVTATFSSSQGGSNAASSIYIPDDSTITGANVGLRGRYSPSNLQDYIIEEDPASLDFMGFAMEYGDINGDGWEDIVVSDTRNSRIIWMENPDGEKTENWTVHVIYAGTYVRNCYGLDIADMDGDGDLDVVTSNYYNYRSGYITYFRNNGGSSWSRYTFYSSFGYAGRVRIADINNDGNPDVVVAPWYYYYYYWSKWVYWFQAPDNPNTTSGWTARSVGSSPYNYYQYVYNAMDVGDFNSDGYIDVAVGVSSQYSWYNNYRGLYIYKNPKTTSGTWSRDRKDSSVNMPYTIETSDLDSDNDIDILLGSYSDSNLYSYENSNSGSTFTRRTLDTNMPSPRSIIAVKANNDSKMDIIASGGSSVFSVKLYTQNSMTSWNKKELTSDIVQPQCFAPYDYDKDNDVDIIVAGYSASQLAILICKNKTTSTYEKFWITDGGIKDIRATDSFDVDEDGDLDLVFVGRSSGYVGIWINDGTPFDGVGNLKRIGSMGDPNLVFWGDVDGDGDEDALAFGSGGVVFWFENPGSENILDDWNQHLALSRFSYGYASAYGFWAGDIDGDGKCDFAISRYGWRDGLIAWYRSPSNPRTDTWQGYNIAPGASYCRGLWGDDMDNDGDIDILAVMGSWGSGTAVYYRNTNPTATWSSVGIGGSMYYPGAIRTIERKDGYRDVVTTETYTYSSYSKVRFWKYQGGTSFSGTIVRSGYSYNVATADIGNDGYADLFFNIGSTIYWYEEPDDPSRGFILHKTMSHSGTAGLTMADLDNDGLPDIISASAQKSQIKVWKMAVTYPEDIGLDVGNDESTVDIQFNGEFRDLHTFNISQGLQDYIDTNPGSAVTTDRWGNRLVSVQMEIISSTKGRITLEGIQITYETTVTVTHDGDNVPLYKVIDRLVPDYPDSNNPITRIYLGVGAEGSGMAYLDALSVEYNAKPRQIQVLPDLTLKEDETKTFGYDLKDFFTDDYTGADNLEFNIILEGSQASKLNAYIRDGNMVIDAGKTPNFYTRYSTIPEITGRITVTDTGGPNGVPPRTLVSSEFEILVEPVNDEPTRTSEFLPTLYAIEGAEETIIVDLDDYELFKDVDGDYLSMLPIPDLSGDPYPYDEEAEFQISWLRSTNELVVRMSRLSDWHGKVKVTMYATDSVEWNLLKNPNVEFIVMVENDNDGPSWLDIENRKVLEDVAQSNVIELTQYVVDIDSDRTSFTMAIEEYTNKTFVKFFLTKNEDDDKQVLSFTPSVADWNGWSTITLSVSDGEYTALTTMIVIVEKVNDAPGISIIRPLEFSRIEPGFFSVMGEAEDVEGIQWVEIFWNNDWYRAVGTNAWGLTLKAEGTNEIQQDVTIDVRAWDGETYALSQVNVSINKKPVPVDLDFDNDGYLNVNDDFEFDPSEWVDTDGDGVGDNSDAFPTIREWQKDSDKDGVADKADIDPFDPEIGSDPKPVEPSGGGDDVEKTSYAVPIFLWVLALIALIAAALSGYVLYNKHSASKDPRKTAIYQSAQQRRRERVHNLMEKLPLATISSKLPTFLQAQGGAQPGTPQPMVFGGGPQMIGRPAMRPTALMAGQQPTMALPAPRGVPGMARQMPGARPLLGARPINPQMVRPVQPVQPPRRV